MTNEAVEIGGDKAKTKEVLTEQNIPVPKGKQFSVDDKEELIEYAKEIGYPLVIKPTDGSFGRDVHTEIETDEELMLALDAIKENEQNKKVIVEQHIPGKDYRIYVVGDEAVAAMIRLPANVIGDGQKSIRRLIEEKNDIREENPRLISCPIEIDIDLENYIAEQGYQLSSVLEKDKQLFLTDKANISTGGDPVTVTEDMPEEVMEVAVKALQAIPGLHHGAVDIIVDERKPIEEAAYVIEVNPTSQLGGLMFPMVGKPCDVPAAIIDYYFPETKEVVDATNDMYFEFRTVIKPLMYNSFRSTEVSPCPSNIMIRKKIILVKAKYRLQDIIWIKNKALDLNFHGYIDIDEQDNIKIVIYAVQDLIDQFILGINKLVHLEFESLYVDDICNHQFIGFRILNEKTLLDKDMEFLTVEKDKLDEQHKKYRIPYYEMLQSFSWKMTSPIRQVLEKIK